MIIEVVCHANICRSPVAAALLKGPIGAEVRSSGIEAVPGKPADPYMVGLLAAELPSLKTHRSTLFTAETARSAELILVMEMSQRSFVLSLFPQAAGKTMLFGHWLDGQRQITDPFGGDDVAYAEAVQRLRLAASSWNSRLAGIIRS